jgi:hypothetical protein
VAQAPAHGTKSEAAELCMLSVYARAMLASGLLDFQKLARMRVPSVGWKSGSEGKSFIRLAATDDPSLYVVTAAGNCRRLGEAPPQFPASFRVLGVSVLMSRSHHGSFSGRNIVYCSDRVPQKFNGIVIPVTLT